ncbi:MAG: hypothetical protein MSS80_07955 [Mollicutes bacterium]|jgi:hypothetical protein|nr:hypothetical protein [Mollicutes bacterium]
MIKIDDKFFIDADSNSYTLKEKDKIQDKKSKNYGEEVFRDRGYYVTLEGVLNGYLKAQTREFVQNNEADIKELIKEIKKQTEFVKKLNLKV